MVRKLRKKLDNSVKTRQYLRLTYAAVRPILRPLLKEKLWMQE